MRSTKIISAHHLRVNKIDNLLQFYSKLLGMEILKQTDTTVSFAFKKAKCKLQFGLKDVDSVKINGNDFYWKIGITVQNLDIAVSHLKQNNIDVTEPKQFRDIGYMSKISDPNGFIIELLQKDFENKHLAPPTGHPIGDQSTFAHITLRVTDIDSSRNFFENELGMRLMSVQPVEPYGFSLYFYSWSNEELPNPNLQSVNNREWLWKRPYTLIELQHLESAEAKVYKNKVNESGMEGFSILNSETMTESFVTINQLEKIT